MSPALIALCAYEAPAAGLGVATGCVGMRGVPASARAVGMLIGFVAWQAWLPLALWRGAVAAKAGWDEL